MANKYRIIYRWWTEKEIVELIKIYYQQKHSLIKELNKYFIRKFLGIKLLVLLSSVFI
jgi:hypothetical protein